jgi:hypothetical protein
MGRGIESIQVAQEYPSELIMEDWRLQGQERYLFGVLLEYRQYKSSSANSDHDHCEFCNSKFSVDSSLGLTAGYSTSDGYHWICAPCFEDFKNKFEWVVRSEDV